jgi:hypothetical protein
VLDQAEKYAKENYEEKKRLIRVHGGRFLTELE